MGLVLKAALGLVNRQLVEASEISIRRDVTRWLIAMDGNAGKAAAIGPNWPFSV